MFSPGICRVLLLAILAAARPEGAVQPPRPAAVRVQLKVSADPGLRVDIRKTLEDELRSLPDVQLTEAAPEYAISVIALKVVNQSRRNVGTTFSVVVTQAAGEHVREFADAHLPPQDREQLATLLAGTVRPLAHWIETASANDVPRVCRSIIQTFNTDVLKERHKSQSY